MTGYILSPAAQADLDSIFDYSAERWGGAQAARYAMAIRDACTELAQGKRTSRSMDAVRPGYRRATVGSHVLFYRLTGNGVVDVIRILHNRMDTFRHL